MSINELGHWSRDHYLAFIMLYCARVEEGIGEEETIHIRGQLGDDDFFEAQSILETCSDNQAVQIITDMRESYFPGDKGSDDLKEYLRGVFQADQKFSQIEKLVFRQLQRLW